jgi:hypothetical protein
MNQEPFQSRTNTNTNTDTNTPSQGSLDFITGYLDMIRQHQDLLVDNVNYMVSSIQHIMTCMRSQQRIIDHLYNIIRSENERNGRSSFRTRTQPTSDVISNSSIYRNRSLSRIQRRNLTRHSTRNMNDILNSIDLTPVLITPTQEQIDVAIETVQYDISQEQQMDPIDLIPFVLNESIVRIRHCGHCFRRSNLLEWFRRNVRCPLCRYDIRDYSPLSTSSSTHSSISDDVSNVNSNNMTGSPQTRIRSPSLLSNYDEHLRSPLQSPINNRYRRLQQSQLSPHLRVNTNEGNITNESNESIYNNEVATAYIYLMNLYPDLSLNYTDVEYLVNDMNANNYII